MPTLGEPPVPPKVRAYDKHRRLGPNKLTRHVGHPLAGLHVQNAVNLGIRPRPLAEHDPAGAAKDAEPMAACANRAPRQPRVTAFRAAGRQQHPILRRRTSCGPGEAEWPPPAPRAASDRSAPPRSPSRILATNHLT